MKKKQKTSVKSIMLKHSKDNDKKFNKKELEKGIKIEKEHSNKLSVRKAITKAHLAEIPDYNTRLLKMEKKAKKSKKNKKTEK